MNIYIQVDKNIKNKTRKKYILNLFTKHLVQCDYYYFDYTYFIQRHNKNKTLIFIIKYKFDTKQ